MASFETYYPKLIAHEGGYVNDSTDKGGETYRGISRKNFPNATVFRYLDEIPNKKKNAIYISLEVQVKKFYEINFWDALKADQIKNQSVAEILVDWKINGGFSTRKVQQMVGEKQDAKIGDRTIAAINKADSAYLFQRIKNARKAHYAQIIRNDPTQAKFEKGWIERVNSFQYTATVAIGLGALVFIGWILYLAMDSKSIV